VKFVRNLKLQKVRWGHGEPAFDLQFRRGPNPPQSDPPRRIIGAWSATAVLLSLLTWSKTPEGSHALCELIGWLKGYHGCMCEDCTAKFIGYSPRSYGGCMVPCVGWSDSSIMAPRLFFAGLFLGIVACCGRVPLTWLARRGEPAPGVCTRCGYSLAGLPSDTSCPECGASAHA
jgi:hypothetical protein